MQNVPLEILIDIPFKQKQIRGILLFLYLEEKQENK